MKKTSGNVHIIAILVIVLLIIGALGYVLWKNFLSDTASKDDTATEQSDNNQQTKRDEIIELESGNYNKYVNHDKHFELMIPKQTSNPIECTLNPVTETNPYKYHTADDDVDSVTVLNDGGDLFFISSVNTLVMSDDNPSDDRLGYESCVEKVTEFSDLSIFGSDDPYVTATKQSFFVSDASSIEDLSRLIQTHVYNSKNFAVTDLGELTGDRYEDMTVEWVGPEDEAPTTGGFAYEFWYYPERQKAVYFLQGHSVIFYLDGGETVFGDFIYTFKFTD
jgi:hypothetical protein